MSVPPTYAASDAGGYERTMGRWSRRLAGPFLDFAGTADGERVLDVGCGTGHLAAAVALRMRGGAVDGVDVAAAYVDDARRRVADPRASFAIGDACALDAPDAAYDRVLSLLVLHFVPRTGVALGEMRRVARPGATLAAAVWDNRGGFVAQRMFWDTAAALFPAAVAQRARHCTRPATRPGELGAALRAAGLADVEETVLAIRMTFESFDDWYGPLEGGEGPPAAWVATLADDGRARLREAARAAYRDADPDGPRSFAALAWAARGRAPG